MDMMRTIEVVINDDVSAFLSNTLKPHDLIRKCTLSELNNKGQIKANRCSKRPLASLGPVIEGFIGNYEKRHCVRSVSSQRSLEKNISLPVDASDFHSSFLTPLHQKRQNAKRNSTTNHEKIECPLDATAVKGSLTHFVSKSSQALDNVPASSLVYDKKSRSKAIGEGCSNVDQSISNSATKLGHNEQKSLNFTNLKIKNCMVLLNSTEIVVSESIEKCTAPKSTGFKSPVPRRKNQEVFQNKTGILHTRSVSSQLPEVKGLHSGSVKVHDTLCVSEKSVKHNPLNSKKIDCVSKSSTDGGFVNPQAENLLFSSVIVEAKSSGESTVLSAEVVNTSRYGRPLKKRYDLGADSCKQAQIVSCPMRRSSRNKVTKSANVNINTASKSIRPSKSSEAKLHFSEIVSKQSEDVTCNSRQKTFPRKNETINNEIYSSDSTNNKRIQDNCKQHSEPSKLDVDENKISSVLPSQSKTVSAFNGHHIEDDKVEPNTLTVKEHKPKDLGKIKSNRTEILHVTENQEGCTDNVKMSRYGRQLKQVSQDHYATPEVVRELRSRMPQKCNRTALFSNGTNFDKLDQSNKPEQKHSVNENEQPVAVKQPSYGLHNKKKVNSKEVAKRKDTDGKHKENIAPENYDTQAEHCTQKRKPAQRQSSRKNGQAVNAEPEKVTAQKGTLKRLQQRHKRQQFILQQQQQEDEVTELLAENPHLVAKNRFRMGNLLQQVPSPSSNRGSSTPFRTVDSSSLLPMMSPVSPFGSVSVGGLSFSTPRFHGNWHWLNDTPATKKIASPQYGGNCNLLLTPVVPDTEDVHRIIFNKGKGRRRMKKKNLSQVMEEEADEAALQPPAAANGSHATKTKSRVRCKGKDFKWLELPSNPTPDYTDDTDDVASVDQYFEDSF